MAYQVYRRNAVKKISKIVEKCSLDNLEEQSAEKKHYTEHILEIMNKSKLGTFSWLYYSFIDTFHVMPHDLQCLMEAKDYEASTAKLREFNRLMEDFRRR